MYFGIAAGSVIGGRVLAVAPVPWLGFVASAILVVTIFVLTWRPQARASAVDGLTPAFRLEAFAFPGH